MEEPTASLSHLAATSKKFARHFLTIGENRLELLKLELHEERERLLQDFLLALGVAAFGLLAGLALTAAVVVLFWEYSPLGILICLAWIYGGVGFALYHSLAHRLRNWETLSSSFDQLRKDRQSLGKNLK